MSHSERDASLNVDPARQDASRVGQWVPGYEIPVINERVARAGAGLLFLPGLVLYVIAATTGPAEPLKPFGALFMIDMFIRVTAGEKWAPSLALGALFVRRQTPEWVGAPQKLFAWWMGYGMGVVACAATGLFQAPLWVTLALCGLCLSFLFLEVAFGICVGCKLQALFSRRPPMYCAGDTCAAPASGNHNSLIERTNDAS